MKKILVSLLMLVMLVSAIAVPAYAANTGNTEFTGFYAQAGSLGPKVPARTKENNSPVYVAITDSVYSKNCVATLGYNKGTFNYDNCTRSGGEYVDYVVLQTGTSGYLIHSHIYEDLGETPATIAFRAYYDPNYLSGKWSPDSRYSYPYASWEPIPVG